MPIFIIFTYSNKRVFFTVKPTNTTINIEIKTGNDGISIVTSITCNSDGFPEPSYNITHDGIVLSTGKMNTISEMQLSASGTYECRAWNKLGRDSASKTLSGKVIFLTRFINFAKPERQNQPARSARGGGRRGGEGPGNLGKMFVLFIIAICLS